MLYFVIKIRYLVSLVATGLETIRKPENKEPLVKAAIITFIYTFVILLCLPQEFRKL